MFKPGKQKVKLEADMLMNFVIIKLHCSVDLHEALKLSAQLSMATTSKTL